jgi:hypothetical protein
LTTASPQAGLFDISSKESEAGGHGRPDLWKKEIEHALTVMGGLHPAWRCRSERDARIDARFEKVGVIGAKA